MFKLIISVLFIAISVYFKSIPFALLVLGANLLKFLYDLGLFTGIKFYKGKFASSEVVFIKYEGDSQAYRKDFLEGLINKFKLDRNIYSTFEIIYKPLQNKSEVIVGLKREILDEIKPVVNKEDSEVREYLKEKGFRAGKLPDMICLLAAFRVLYPASVNIGINKFTSSLANILKDKDFLKSYDVKEAEPSFVARVYQNDEIKFYVPLKTNEKFMKLLE